MAEIPSVLVSDTRVGRVDTTPLLKVLKERHPEIVSIVLTADTDVDVVIKLINQGQIYRFIPKPVKAGFLKIMLASAVQRHREIKNTPGAAQRYAVEKAPEGTAEKLVQDIKQEAARLRPSSGMQGDTFPHPDRRRAQTPLQRSLK